MATAETLQHNGDYNSLTFLCPRIVSIIVIDDKQDATFLVYLFIPNQLCMFRAMFSPIIRSSWQYLQLLILSTDIAAGNIVGALYHKL